MWGLNGHRKFKETAEVLRYTTEAEACSRYGGK
jgi:hypothetical protein